MTSVRNEDPRVDRLIVEVQELTSVLKVLVDTIKRYRKIAKAKLMTELQNFKSIEDDRLNAQMSFQRAIKNNQYINSGLRQNSDVLLPLYQFGTN